MEILITMLQKNFLAAPERFWECVDCNSTVLHPLCPTCLAGQIEAWLSSYPTSIKARIMHRIREYVQKTANLTGKTTKCIVCGKYQAALCPYCFTDYVFAELKKLHMSRIILKEFLQFFNFDFDHTGYTKDAEQLGII